MQVLHIKNEWNLPSLSLALLFFNHIEFRTMCCNQCTMKVARCIYFTDIGILSIVLDSVSSAHPWMLRPLSSNEDTKAKSYVILIGAKNALIWCNFGKDLLLPFWGRQGQRTFEVQIWSNPKTKGSLVLQVTFKN